MNIHPIFLFIIGIGFSLLGNGISASAGSAGGIVDIFGLGVGLFGNILIIYAIYLGLKRLFGKKNSEKKPNEDAPKGNQAQIATPQKYKQPTWLIVLTLISFTWISGGTSPEMQKIGTIAFCIFFPILLYTEWKISKQEK